MFANIEEQIYELFKQVEKDKYLMLYSRCLRDKEFYKQSLSSNLDLISGFLSTQIRLYGNNNMEENEGLNEFIYDMGRQKEFTLDELKQYDGSGGKAAYVAVDGVVYDVSHNVTWGGGSHFGLIAGKDLSQAFNGCHISKEVLNNIPIVGKLKII